MSATACPTCGAPSYVLPARLAERRARMYAAAPEPPAPLPCAVHLWERLAAACEPDPGDGLAPYRAEATPEERAACPHPVDDRVPLSGDGWLCSLCGADCAAPPRAVEEPGPEDEPSSGTNHRWSHAPGCLWDAEHREWGCVPGCPVLDGGGAS